MKVWQDLVEMDGEKLTLRGKGGKEYTFYVKRWLAKTPQDRVLGILREGKSVSVRVDMETHEVLGIYASSQEEVDKNSVAKKPAPAEEAMDVECGDRFSEEVDAMLKRYLDKGLSLKAAFKVLRDKVVQVSDILLEEGEKDGRRLEK